MILDCKVILNNESVTVIRYGDKNIQIPPIGRKAKTVKVKDDGKYTVVPDDYTELENLSVKKQSVPEAAEKKKRARKKKTIEIEEVPFLEG